MTNRALLFFVLCIFLIACKSQSDPGPGASASPETIVSSTPPFQTKEPDRYRATRTITISTPDGQTVVTKTSIARDGDMRRQESETGSKRVAYLDRPDGRFVLLVAEKVYADLATANETPANEDEVTPEHLLHTDTESTTYQKLGAEVIRGRNANKYRIVVNNSSAGNVSVGETLIWIDEALSMPIRSETTSPDGTRIKTELTDIVLEVDNAVFQVPEGYEKIAFSEFRKRLGKAD